MKNGGWWGTTERFMQSRCVTMQSVDPLTGTETGRLLSASRNTFRLLLGLILTHFSLLRHVNSNITRGKILTQRLPKWNIHRLNYFIVYYCSQRWTDFIYRSKAIPLFVLYIILLLFHTIAHKVLSGRHVRVITRHLPVLMQSRTDLLIIDVWLVETKKKRSFRL